MNKIDSFLFDHGFIIPDAETLSQKIFSDMCQGLEGQPSDQPMIITENHLPKKKATSEATIVIDAGGTNFRSCIVTFNEAEKAEISDLRKTTMPGIECSLSKEEFYQKIEENIHYLKDKATRIGFCFSYALKSLPDGDAEILAFSKEIKAQEAIGSRVGFELKKVLKQNGWNIIPSICILNDTTAALLSGVTAAHDRNFSSFAGFILGTGINNAYYDHELEKIVVCECGMFSHLKKSDFDNQVDKESAKPGSSPLEKMCSGVYLGKLIHKIILCACDNNVLFSEDFIRRFKVFSQINSLDFPTISLFLKASKKSSLADSSFNFLSTGISMDKETFTYICKKVIERVSVIVSAVLIATARKGSPYGKICIVCNGSTFWKTPGLYSQIISILNSTKELPEYELLKVEEDITLGTAVSVL